MREGILARVFRPCHPCGRKRLSVREKILTRVFAPKVFGPSGAIKVVGLKMPLRFAEKAIQVDLPSMFSGMSTATTWPLAQTVSPARRVISTTTLRGFTSTIAPRASSGMPIGVGLR